MSNKYNNELEQALKETNNQLLANEQTQANLVDSSKINLYFAHGITENASTKLNADQDKSDESGRQFHAAVSAYQVCENIVTDANSAALDAGNTTSSVSTAAASFQQAANTLTNLWSDTASVLAVATSVDNNSKIQELAATSNALTERAAKGAELSSLISLNTTIEASQSRAANVVTQAGVVKTNMENLEKVLEGDFSTLQTQVTTDLSELSDAIESESQKAGAFYLAKVEEDASKTSEEFINEKINHDLKFKSFDGKGNRFVLSFNKFMETQNEVNTDPCKKDDHAEPTPIIEEYRVMIVPSDMAPSFDIQSAKSVNNVNLEDPESIVNRYVKVQPSGKKTYEVNYFLNEYFAMNVEDRKNSDIKYNALDFQGNPIERGEDYNFFVYVVYTNDYQVLTGNTEGFLSLQSPEFINLTNLPNPSPNKPQDGTPIHKLDFTLGRTEDEKQIPTMNVSFTMNKDQMVLPNSVELDLLMDFRVFIISQENKEALEINEKITAQMTALNQAKTDLNNAKNDLEQSMLTYNNLIADSKSTTEQIEEARKDVTDNQKAVVEKTAEETKQQMLMNALYGAKLNDFYIDTTVLENIPVAYSSVAKRLDVERYLQQLKIELDELNFKSSYLDEKIKALDANIATNNAQQEELNKSLSETQDQANSLQTEVTAKQSKLDADIKKLLKLLKQEGTEVNTYEVLAAMQSTLPETKRINELYEQIVEDWKALNELKIQLAGVEGQLKELNQQVDTLASELVVLNSEKVLLADQETSTKAKISSLQDQINIYGEKTGDENLLWYASIDNGGDFTDNYGEPLVPGKSYCAMVFSIIKPSQPDAVKIYQPIYSTFSGASIVPPLVSNN